MVYYTSYYFNKIDYHKLWNIIFECMRVHLLLRVLKSAFWIASSVISIVPTTTVKTTVSQQPLQGYYLFEKIYKILILYKMSARSIFELQLSHGFNILSFFAPEWPPVPWCCFDLTANDLDMFSNAGKPLKQTN